MNNLLFHQVSGNSHARSSHVKSSGVSFLYSKEEWQKDQATRFNLEELNQAFYESVPSLKYLDWSIVSIERGEVKTILPLNTSSTNQYVTHQAALILLAADYTGGIALCTLFQMVPVIGFHPMETDYGAYVWGAKAKIKWHSPSCDDLICRAEIPEREQEILAKRFFAGKRVIVTLRVNMYNQDKLVAEADFTYWAQDSYNLRKNAYDKVKVNVLYDHQFKTSAKLIAGLRAMEQEKNSEQRLFDDPYAFMVAQKHGVTLAKRFCQTMPQLQPMVAARTKSLDDFLLDLDENWNIINIGCGLDCRPWRLNLKNPLIYELDLPLMLDMRDEILPNSANANGEIRTIAIDLRCQCISEALSKQQNFDRHKPTFIIWEGGSMYFDDTDTQKILTSISKLLSHADSRIWFDYVSQEVVDNSTGLPSIESFMRGMRRMGEPFITGYRDIQNKLVEYGLDVEIVDKCNKYLDDTDPIFEHYRFCLAKKSVNLQLVSSQNLVSS